MLSSSKYVLMIGPALSAPGGMSSVVAAYDNAGFFRTWNVRYIDSYIQPGLFNQIAVMYQALRIFLKMLICRQVRLIHVHSASRGSFWRKAVFCGLARLFNCPYIFHIHSGEFPIFYQKECGSIGKWIVRRTLERASAVIALTDSWKTSLRSIAPQAKIVAMGNFVVFRHQNYVGGNDIPQVLFLGRLREKKGVFDLVNAMPLVLRKFPNVKFTLAGDGDLDAVEELAASLGVEKNLVLPGWIEGRTKDSLLAEASLLVLPSYFEGLPICILEAMATRVPVVATNVGGIPEVLENGKCGLIFEPGDVDAMASAIILLLSDSSLCERIQEDAYIRVEQLYSAKAIIGALSSLYETILSSKEAQHA